MRVFILSSSELAAERFPFEMVLIAPSIASSRELLNSYCTLFPLKLKELEALDSIFSFFSWDWVAVSFSSRSRLNAANFWSNLTSKSWENNCKVSALDNVEPDDPEAVVWTGSPSLKDSAIKAGTLARSVSDSITNKANLKEMPFSGSCITYKILNSLTAPRDSSHLQAR